jgi:hypothetical protein
MMLFECAIQIQKILRKGELVVYAREDVLSSIRFVVNAALSQYITLAALSSCALQTRSVDGNYLYSIFPSICNGVQI